MEKHIIDKLVKFGLITNIGVDASKYKDVDDLIAKGIVTIPGAKDKIAELLGDDLNIEPDEPFTYVDDEQTPQPTIVNEVINEVTNEVINEVLDDNSPVIDETPETAPVIDETPETVEPIVDTPADVEPIDETPEVVEPEIVVEEVNDEVSETIEEPVKKTRKSKKTE